MGKNTLKTSFGKWIVPNNFGRFQKTINLHKRDHYTRKLTTQSFVLLMFYSHLNEMESLYAMEASITDDNLQNALGFRFYVNHRFLAIQEK
ncbi:DUF4372 domain-containing protein [Filibacter tadaridae]|uniref:DUF4372 domain-containing protein n=1 Tax=Filibacter tadaridae TaxID=2483811 RepID=A0A3P5XG13_9BACL|nr:DUF4372 domain-containing protein [Filibacter tadaridae]VDC33726.1 hypothetical protein FILTAD_03029 [Filibacter tadaridae]